MVDIASYFRHCGWTCEEVEPGVWHSTFADEAGEPYDLYVLAAEDWVQVVVSPLVGRASAGMTEELHAHLLHANQDLRMVRLALDADGDVNLLADLPIAHINATLFGQVLELLAYYANALAPQLRQVVADPSAEPRYNFTTFE
jgi:hypothetical protein